MQFALTRQTPVADWRVDLLRRAVAGGTLLLLAVTWRLWTPQDLFPQVPLIAPSGRLPAWFDWGLFAALIVSLAAAILLRQTKPWRLALGLTAVLLAASCLVDQHRLQPWAVQAMLLAAVLACCEPSRAFLLASALAVSIYAYSGLSKLDETFLSTLGQQLLATLFDKLGISFADWSAQARWRCTLALPIGELVIAVGLTLRRTRPAALIASWILHGLLLVALGPWGLRHSWGVLVWNALLMLENGLLFTRTAAEVQMPAEPDAVRRWPGRVVEAILVAALALPLVEPWGWYDTWPGWALYSPGGERTAVFVHRLAAERLAALEPFLVPVEEDDAWLRLRMDRWSLETLGVPIYPQNRFQLGVALAVGRRHDLDNRLRAVLISRADRRSGQRQEQTLLGLSQTSDATRQFWLGARPAGPFLKSPPREP